MTVQTALLNAAKQLHNSEAALEAQLLLQHVLKVNHAWLITHQQDTLSDAAYQRFHALLQRRVIGEPIAYILGEREFYGLKLQVTADTLIPRPDTETLVEAALERIADKAFQVLDLGTGTGAVALAIAHHRPQAQLTAVDASQKALDVAKSNARQLNIENVSFHLSDWYEAVTQQTFDMIVSNPPYIEQQDPHLSKGDLRFEPHGALVAGNDGLADIRKILVDCLVYLKPQGWLLLEHGYQQAHAVQDLMAEAGLVEVATLQDLGRNDRVTLGKNPLHVSQHWAS